MQTLAPTWNLGQATTAKWYLRLFPSLNDIAFLLPIFVLFARLNGTQLLFSDGDTGWHIRTGEWILAHHAVPTVDLFSFTRPNETWFAWEWAWDVLAAIVHHYSGLGGIGFITSLLLGLFVLLVYRLALRVSHNNVLSIVVAALTAAVSSIHWLARPHLVSWIFLLVFLHLLESARAEQSRPILLLLPLITMFWVNLHGGFVAGLLVIACYAVGEALTCFLTSEAAQMAGNLKSAWRASAVYWQSLALCLLATLVNPYGWHLHKHIFAYLSDSELLDKIQEFQSISFHAGPAVFLEIMLLLAALAVYQNLRNRQLTPVLLIGLWAHFALLSARHIPLFMAVAAPFAAAGLATALKNARDIPALAGAARTIDEICQDVRALECTPRLHLMSAAALVLIAGLFALGQSPFIAQFNPEAFPVQAIPLLRNHPGSRVFTTDQWGDYLLYRLYPAQRVFFDGRSDFYGNDFVKLNQRIASAEHDWKALLKSFAIKLVVLRPESPLSAVLKLTPDAQVLFDDGKVIVFDTHGFYQPVFAPTDQEPRRKMTGSPEFLRESDSSNRVPSLSPTMPPATLATKSQKGKTS